MSRTTAMLTMTMTLIMIIMMTMAIKITTTTTLMTPVDNYENDVHGIDD